MGAKKYFDKVLKTNSYLAQKPPNLLNIFYKKWLLRFFQICVKIDLDVKPTPLNIQKVYFGLNSLLPYGNFTLVF